MEKEKLRALDVPVLRAILQTHLIQMDRVCEIARATQHAMTLSVLVANHLDEPIKQTFYFPAKEMIPTEITTALHSYATRLCAERWIIEDIISEKETQLTTAPANE